MMRCGIELLVLSAVLLAGCGDDDSAVPMATAPTVASPGAAPSYGTSSGMGFSTGDAAHSGGAGTGLMGYNHEGAMGTSSAITDQHPIVAPTHPTTAPVMQAP